MLDLKAGNNKIFAVSDPTAVTLGVDKLAFSMFSLNNGEITQTSLLFNSSSTVVKYEFTDSFSSLIVNYQQK